MRWMQQIRLLLVAVATLQENQHWLQLFQKLNWRTSFGASLFFPRNVSMHLPCSVLTGSFLCPDWFQRSPRDSSANHFYGTYWVVFFYARSKFIKQNAMDMSTHHNSWPAGMLKMTNTWLWLCKLWRMQTREAYSRISKPHKGTTLNETMRGGNACGTRKPSFEKISHHSSSPPPNHPPPPSPPSPPSSPPPNHPPLESLDPPLSPYQLSPPPRPLSGEDPGGGGEASPPGAAPPSSFLCTTSICLGPRIPSIMRDATEVPTPHARPSINAPRNPPPMPPTAGAPASGGGCTAEGFGAPNAVVWFVCLFHQ